MKRQNRNDGPQSARDEQIDKLMEGMSFEERCDFADKLERRVQEIRNGMALHEIPRQDIRVSVLPSQADALKALAKVLHPAANLALDEEWIEQGATTALELALLNISELERRAAWVKKYAASEALPTTRALDECIRKALNEWEKKPVPANDGDDEQDNIGDE